MAAFFNLLDSNTVVVLDGATGTVLMAAGLEAGNPPEPWTVDHPERIRAMHRDYIAAGSQLILTNTFGGNRYRLKLHQLQDRVADLNQAAARLARTEAAAVTNLVVVAGSMGPTGEMIAPLGVTTAEEAQAAFAEQARALVAGGVDMLWIETMSDLTEVQAAIAGVQSVTDLPVAATMTFDTHGRTMMGVSPAQAIETLSALGVAAVGANCGNGPAEIEAVITAMHATNPAMPLIAKSNAGLPQLDNGQLYYDGTPDVMAAYAQRVQAAGARLIGGCCGTTPTHIAAMRAALQG